MNYFTNKLHSTFLYKVALAVLVTCSLTACDKDQQPTANIPDTPLEKPLEIIMEPKKVAMTDDWVAGIKDDGTLWTWGGGGNNLAVGGFDPTPKQVQGVHDAVAISGGTGHMLLLRKDGSVWGWGFNYDGVVDPTDKEPAIYKLRKIEGLSDIVDISAGSENSFFINKNGEVYVIGDNKDGWVNGMPSPPITPTKLPNLKDIVRLEETAGTVLALNNKGEVYTTGNGGLGRPVQQIPKDKPQYYPAQKVDLPRKVVDITMSMLGCMVLLDNGEVWVWGYVSGAGLALPKGQHPELPIKHPTLKRIVNIGDRSAVDVEGNLYIWGAIGYGSYNAPSQSIYRTPIKIAENMNNPAMIVKGGGASGVLTKNGELYAWGSHDGMFGMGKSTDEYPSRDDVLTVKKSLFTTHVP